jgi:hypothetical protein
MTNQQLAAGNGYYRQIDDIENKIANLAKLLNNEPEVVVTLQIHCHYPIPIAAELQPKIAALLRAYYTEKLYKLNNEFANL